MRLDCSLNGETNDRTTDMDVAHKEIRDAVKEAGKFLKKFLYVKIVVVIDTHSTENRGFVYEGERGSYRSCYMLDVSDSQASSLPLSNILIDHQGVHPSRDLPVRVGRG